ncbi:ribonuclease H-like domain-containing protein [Tanacetum coccineum]
MSANDKFGLGYGDHRYDGILSYENEVLQSVFMNKESDIENQPVYDRFAEGMHAVPPPMTGNYMPSGPEIEIDYSQFTYGPKQTQPSESESQSSEFDTCESNISIEPSELVSEPVVNKSNVECQPKVWSDAPIIEEYESDSDDECVVIPTKQQETPSFANQQVKTPRENVKSQYTHSQKPKVDKKDLGYGFAVRACFVCGSLNHLIRDCDFHEKRMARKAELNNGWNNVQRVNKQNQFVPSAVLTRTGIIPVNTARTSSTKNFSTARQSVNRQTVLTSTAMKVNTVKPIMNRVRPANVFHKTHSPSSRPFKKTTVLRTDFSKQKVNTAKDYPHRALKNKGIVDSGCSRHMTGNKAYLAEFQDFNGGPVAFGGSTVAFGGSKGYITGKGVNKKEQGSVYDSECLVLSPEFKSKGIKREYSNARTPQQNGVAERKNRTLIEAARTMLADSFLPNTFVGAEAVRKGPTWLFDLDYLTDSMNYQPIRSENQATHAGPQEANHNAGTEDIIDAGDSEKEDESAQDCFVLPIWSSDSSTITPDFKRDAKREGPKEEEKVFLDELERLKRQEKDANKAVEALRKEFAQETENLIIQEGAAKASSTNIFSTISTPAKASSTNLVNTVSTPVSIASPHEGLSLSDPTNPEQDDSEIPPLEDIYQNSTDGIFTNSSYDDEGAVANFTNLETVVNVSPIPTSRINSSHPLALILGDPTSAGGNIKDFQHCLFAMIPASQNMNLRRFQKHLKMKVGFDALQEELFAVKIRKLVISSRFALWEDRRGTIDKTLFIKKDNNDIILVQVYVDDIIFWSTKKSWCDEFEALMKKFLKKFDFANVKTASTPIETQKPLVKDEKASDVDVHLYCCPHFDLESNSGLDGLMAGQQILTGNPQQEIQNQMLDYGFNFMNTKIYIDNESTICIVKNPVYHSKTKHIAIRHHFIRDPYEKKLIQVPDLGVTIGMIIHKTCLVKRRIGNMIESLRRVFDGTEALLLPTLFILWLATVSTDSAKLVPLGKVCTAIETFKKNTAKGQSHPLFASMLVQATEDEGAPSERPSEAQPTRSPTQTSEVPLVPQNDPSPTHTMKLPESSGRESWRSFIQWDINLFQVNNEGEMTLIVSMFFFVSLYVHRESVSNREKFCQKMNPSIHKDPLFDEIPEDTLDYMETKDAQIVGWTRDGVDEAVRENDEDVLVLKIYLVCYQKVNI